MAVTIRLARHGRKKRPFYRIVAAEKECRRDGRFIEIVGNYNPLLDPPAVNLKEERVKYWLSQGAQTTATLRGLLLKKLPGVMEGLETDRREKLKLRRKQRRERIAARA